MNAPHVATDLLDRQHHTTWARAMVSGQTTGHRPISSIDPGRHVTHLSAHRLSGVK